MRIQVVTLFPEMFRGVFGTSIIGRARRRGVIDLRLVPLRPFGRGPHRSTDDYPFGGGAGMLLRADVLVPAVEWAQAHAPEPARVLFTSPRGRVLTQGLAAELSREAHLIVVAGHYEGYDERALLLTGAEEVSVGDFVLSGGEIPAMALVDAVVRLLPGALGSAESIREESFSGPDGGLEAPQYTRPLAYRGLAVPEVLVSGNHAAVAHWRQEQSRALTAARRPDLLAGRVAGPKKPVL
ncbi:MAG: tRNA (guanosine(37)-N1)-methyltransferase TrmD [Firmicutes bacterium]|nr:tRNA (guanosine(37)-N1)-methyltransferase TrmD [Bacillota bacterium]